MLYSFLQREIYTLKKSGALQRFCDTVRPISIDAQFAQARLTLSD